MIESPFAQPSESEVKEEEAKGLKAPEEKPAEEPIKEETEHFKILREHGGQESNIPINHRYWKIRP